jgi:hypothetical protein
MLNGLPGRESKAAAAMNLNARRRFLMLARVGAFGAAHAEHFPAGSMGSQLFATVLTCVTDAARHEAAQESGRGEARGATTSVHAARRALRKQLEAIRRTARALALDAPAFERRFRLPRGNSDGRLLLAGRLFARLARKRSSDFIAHGLPSTFLADLSTAIGRFEDAAHDRAQNRRARISAATDLKRSLDAGFVAVRRLDAVVINLLEDSPRVIAAWETARRQKRTPRRPRHEAA